MATLTDVRDLSAIGYGFMASKALFAALDLELFTHLANGPLSADELERRTGAAPNPLRTLLRACTSLGLLGHEGERYVNSQAAAQYLDRGAPRYYGDYFRYQIDRQVYPVLEHLRDTLCGRAAKPLYARMQSPQEAELFSNAQHVGSLGPAHLVAQRVDGSRWNHLLDVAGGSGAFSIAFCRRNPALRATILDFPSVVPIADRYAERAGLSERIATIAGDALATEWPAADAVLLSCLFSAVPMASIGALLEKARCALRSGGTLVVHDFMLDETRHGPRHAALWFLASAVGVPEQVSFSADDLATLLRDHRFNVDACGELLPGLTGLVRATAP